MVDGAPKKTEWRTHANLTDEELETLLKRTTRRRKRQEKREQEQQEREAAAAAAAARSSAGAPWASTGQLVTRRAPPAADQPLMAERRSQRRSLDDDQKGAAREQDADAAATALTVAGGGCGRRASWTDSAQLRRSSFDVAPVLFSSVPRFQARPRAAFVYTARSVWCQHRSRRCHLRCVSTALLQPTNAPTLACWERDCARAWELWNLTEHAPAADAFARVVEWGETGSSARRVDGDVAAAVAMWAVCCAFRVVSNPGAYTATGFFGPHCDARGADAVDGAVWARKAMRGDYSLGARAEARGRLVVP